MQLRPLLFCKQNIGLGCTNSEAVSGYAMATVQIYYIVDKTDRQFLTFDEKLKWKITDIKH